MKWFALSLFSILLVAPCTVRAQDAIVVPIGHITQVDDRSPTTWGMSGWEMIHITRTIGNNTPIMRSMTLDARTVEILSRAQAPPITPSDIRSFSKNGHEYIVVRRFLLFEVQPEDARAEGLSKAALAAKWASGVRKVLPKVAPYSRFGV